MINQTRLKDGEYLVQILEDHDRQLREMKSVAAGSGITTVIAGSGLSGGGTGSSVTVSLTTPVTIALGGTNATSASAARTNLGVAIGSDVQAFSATLSSWASKTVPSGTVLGSTDTQVVTNKDFTSGTNTFPTFNQNTTGSAAKWTTARNLAGNSVDGSTNVAFANKFIVQGTTDTGLSAAQFLGALATGIVKNTTTTGVLSIATGADLPAATATVGGAVPTPPNNTTTFLRGDATWAAPAGSTLKLGYTTITASQNTITTEVDVTGATLTFTPDGTRDVELVFYCANVAASAAAQRILLQIKESTTVKGKNFTTIDNTSGTAVIISCIIPAPSNASHTYKVTAQRDTGAGNVSLYGDATGGHMYFLARYV